LLKHTTLPLIIRLTMRTIKRTIRPITLPNTMRRLTTRIIN
jgi:hypothetical protein